MFCIQDIIKGMINAHIPDIPGYVQLIEACQNTHMVKLVFEYERCRHGCSIPWEMTRLVNRSVRNDEFDMSWDTDITMTSRFITITLREDD